MILGDLIIVGLFTVNIFGPFLAHFWLHFQFIFNHFGSKQTKMMSKMMSKMAAVNTLESKNSKNEAKMHFAWSSACYTALGIFKPCLKQVLRDFVRTQESQTRLNAYPNNTYCHAPGACRIPLCNTETVITGAYHLCPFRHLTVRQF